MRSQVWTMGALVLLSTTVGVLFGGAAHAQSLHGEALVKALRQGGYVIVMRHASSPGQPPSKQDADPENVKLERQLDAHGRASAAAMGKAFRALKIPVGNVLSSPTYRALETVRLARFGEAKTYPELGDGGKSMQGATDAQAAFLQKQVTQLPKGSNTLIVTHMPNLMRAFPKLATGLTDGEALIFGPDGKGGTAFVARVKIDEWPELPQR
jgi:phosphohistidine phosphatase SixA